MKWSAFPSGRNAKLWISHDDTVARALSLYRPYSTRGKIAKAAFGSLPENLARRLLSRPSGDANLDRLEKFVTDIAEMSRWDDISISFSTGTPGPHRKLTAQISSSGEICAYAKIGETDAARLLVEREFNVLQGLARAPIASAAIPGVVGFRKTDEYSLLIQKAASGTYRQRPSQLSEMDISLLGELSIRNRTSAPLAQCLKTGAYSKAQDVVTGSDSQSRTWANAIRYLTNEFDQALVQMSSAHGDYAPWNTLENNQGRGGSALYVFDWEYGSNSAPALTDLFHALLMPRRLLNIAKPERVVAQLCAIDTDTALARVLDKAEIERHQLPAYLMLYLLRQVLRELDDNGVPDRYLTNCAHRLLIREGYAAERRRVLVGAYACEADQGSEPGVGWNMANAIAAENDAWIITRENNRNSIERELAIHPNPHLHFHYADLPKWARFWKKGSRGIRLYYYLWQFAALREARDLHRSVDFDLAHHVTFVNDYMFSFLALLPIPFVWGPLGSNPRWPAQLSPARKALFKDTLRSYIQSSIRSLDPLFWLCTVRSRLILGINRDIGKQIPFRWLAQKKFIVHSAIGVEAFDSDPVSANSPDDQFTVLTMGKLLPVKGFRLAVHGFSHCHQQIAQSRMLIVGSGPEKKALVELVDQLGIAHKVTFIDWLPREEALAMMKNADVFLYPSFEGSGMVVLEAMASGVPVICLDFGGAGEMVSQECGFRIPIGTFSETAKALGKALETTVTDRALASSMGAAARRRVQKSYLWGNRHLDIRSWYQQSDR